MRVLLLTDADVFAGTERLILELASALVAMGVQATIGCPVPSPLADKAAAESIAVLQVGMAKRPKGGSADVATICRIRAALRRSEFDIVHVHNGRSALIAAVAGAGRRVPMVMSQHFLRPARTTRRGLRGAISRCVHAWLDTRIARHLAISEAVRAAAISGGVADASKIELVFNGIRPPVPCAVSLCAKGSDPLWLERQDNASDVPAKGQTPLRIGQTALPMDCEWLSEAEPFIFCAARAEPEKDLPTLVQAMLALRASHPTARCAIAGGGREKAKVQGIIDAAGGDRNVQLLGFRDDVAALMSACDVFVLPAPAEPFGLVLLEAMALGKPVVACDAGGPREIVEHGVTGWLVEPGSATAMAAALGQLANDAELRGRLGAAGRGRYEAMFTAEVMAKRMVKVYAREVGGE